MGLRFDTVISGYILLAPFLYVFILWAFARPRAHELRPVHTLLFLLYSPCFLGCIADLPFYGNYQSRLNITILNWSASPEFILKMIWQDNKWLMYIGLWVAILYLYHLLMRRTFKRYSTEMAARMQHRPLSSKWATAAQALLFTGCILLAIRGRVEGRSPIQPGTSYFCEYDLANKAGLNPMFNLVWSWTDGWKDENRPLAFVNDTIARDYVQNYLHRPANAPIQVYDAGDEKRYNVVLVLMESMSAYYTAAMGNGNALTPNLDTLAERGISFHNFYSAGIHTFNGIFSVLYGHPALMARHTMEGAYIPSFRGMPYYFKKRGYETIYFTTHDGEFDNVSGFLSANHMQQIVTKSDYKEGRIWSVLGVADHEMFDNSLQTLDQCHSAGRPFFATLMTSSNHSPYILPDNIPFSPHHTEVRGGCVEYADWAIGRFMQMAASHPWYANTIFVFTGDHGSYDGPSYAGMPLCYNRVPFIIYGPHLGLQQAVKNDPGGQIDIFPTIVGLLGGYNDQATLGTDLLRHPGRWAFFSQDDKIGITSEHLLYIWHKDGHEYLIDLDNGRETGGTDHKLADSMRHHAFCFIQYSQWLRQNGMTGRE
ncbi:LTA synthase family protein [Nemorincola caseinilytica]|uniref:LTA synthase family protein n=2 Tax=Nemorincola caseinilytica TaxID=2054315 RepID=A0ABP8N3W4_9BACT